MRVLVAHAVQGTERRHDRSSAMDGVQFSTVLDDSTHFVIRDTSGHEFIFGILERGNGRRDLVGTAVERSKTHRR